MNIIKRDERYIIESDDGMIYICGQDKLQDVLEEIEIRRMLISDEE